MSNLRIRIDICSIIIHLTCILKVMTFFSKSDSISAAWRQGYQLYWYSLSYAAMLYVSYRMHYVISGGSFETINSSNGIQKTIFSPHTHHHAHIPDKGTRDTLLELMSRLTMYPSEFPIHILHYKIKSLYHRVIA